MGIRFRRSIKLFPGVSLNISKRGLSTTVGGRGARMTIGHGKTTGSIGVPGTGLSYTATQARRDAQPASQKTPAELKNEQFFVIAMTVLFGFTALVIWIFS